MLKRYHEGEGPATAFAVLPAIDLRGGRVVRLEQGDFERETAFSGDPVAVASGFAAAGAAWLHVVDLDGARSGSPVHTQVIGEIVRAVPAGVRVEVAGGLRSADAVASVLDAGAHRAVIGTVALREPEVAGDLVAAHGSQAIAVALDVRGDLAVGHGWVSGAGGVPVEDALRDLADRGVATFEVTAIERDGLLQGPDLSLYRRLIALRRGSIIASAGVATLADIRAVREAGCEGVIVGRALYDGRVRLEDGLRA